MTHSLSEFDVPYPACVQTVGAEDAENGGPPGKGAKPTVSNDREGLRSRLALFLQPLRREPEETFFILLKFKKSSPWNQSLTAIT